MSSPQSVRHVDAWQMTNTSNYKMPKYVFVILTTTTSVCKQTYNTIEKSEKSRLENIFKS